MKSGDSRPDKLSRAEARDVIREIASDGTRIIFHRHALARIAQRGILVTQVRQVVQTGAIVEGPYLDAQDCWRVDMQGRAAGARLTVALAILWPERLLVITVYEVNESGGRR
jgi:hypothetical protein